MNVGYGHLIDDKWIPKGIPTGLKDINGVEILTGQRVGLIGCKSDFAFVGKDHRDRFVLFFGTENASVSWDLDQETVQKHNVCVWIA